MFIKARRAAVAGLLCAAALLGQERPLSNGSVNLKLPADSPLAVMSMSTGDSHASARGAALVLDLHMSLTLQNISSSRVHGLTLRVVSQEVTLGGKSSVSLLGLNVGPRETFPVHIDMQLLRPTQVASGTLVDVNLDGVLFEDLSFYGPDRLNSRRTMTAWEVQAQRDREYYKRVLAQGGPEGLRRALLDTMARAAARPRLDVSVIRGPAVTSAAFAPERTEQFAFVDFPDAPVVAMHGWALVSGNEARSPRIQVRNRSDKAVNYVELGWLVRDQGGQQYLAASVPAADPLLLPAGRTARVEQDTALRFTRNGQPVNINSALGYVSRVQFSDGKLWVPTRQDIESSVLLKVLPPSAEEQRLSDLYLKHGIDGLVDELKKF